MNTRKLTLCASLSAALVLAAGSAQAAGDAAKGKKQFRKCSICHSLKEGKKKVGPSLYKVIGRPAGTAPNYRYSADFVEAGKKGLKWDQASLVAYLEDPKKFLAGFLKKPSAKSRMRNKYKKLQMREDIAAYLHSLK